MCVLSLYKIKMCARVGYFGYRVSLSFGVRKLNIIAKC